MIDIHHALFVVLGFEIYDSLFNSRVNFNPKSVPGTEKVLAPDSDEEMV